jgi:hypothetical protein
MIKIKLLFVSCLIFLCQSFTAQSNTATPEAKEEDEFAKKKVATKLTEVIPTDSVPASELLKRADHWAKQEAPTYKKTAAASSADKMECVASFPVKPKELNPQVDYTGKVTMKVLIECKNSKYRYTISEIKHVSKSGKSNGGLIDNRVPECGSMGMTDVVWKKLRGEALVGAAKVASDIKAAMSSAVPAAPVDEW